MTAAPHPATTASQNRCDLLRYRAGDVESWATTPLPADARPAVGRWLHTLPAAAWHHVLGDRTVQVSIDAPDGATLHGRIGAQDHLLAQVPSGSWQASLEVSRYDRLWFTGERLDSVRWSVPCERTLPHVDVVMPTYRREDDALAQARRFAAMDLVHRVLVVDQGGTLAADPRTEQLIAEHPQVRLLTQRNLGGSGGYARGMLASLEDPDCAVLLSDDDAILTEEGLRRMLAVQTLAARPTIVGTCLFSDTTPTRLMVHAERVRESDFWWTPADALTTPLDLRDIGPSDWDALTPAHRPNYTGWWGTLLPPGTVAELGLPAPFFLKWDDAEYGLRATQQGYDHVVLPGADVHHPSWSAYSTQMTWAGRLLHRNRLVAAAAMGAGRGVIASSLVHQAKHVLAGHHLTADLWAAGIDAVLTGPRTWLGTDLERARTDGQAVVDAWRAEQRPLLEGLSPTRRHPLPLPRAALRSGLHLLLPDRRPRIVLGITAQELTWRSTLGADAVLVTDAVDGFVVRGSRARRLLARTIGQHARLALRWGRLHGPTARALREESSAAAWTRTLAPTEEEN